MGPDIVLGPSDDPFGVFAGIKGGEPGQAIISQQMDADWLMLDPPTGTLMTETRSGGLNIGCGKVMAPNTFFTGLIDHVRIYNRTVKP